MRTFLLATPWWCLVACVEAKDDPSPFASGDRVAEDTGTTPADDAFSEDPADDDTADGDSGARRAGRCEARFTVRYLDGTASTFDGCADWDLETRYAFDPDVPPEISAASLHFDAWDEESFVCEVRLQLGYLCAAGTYPLSAQTGVSWSTQDCPDTSAYHEGNLTGSTGYIDVWSVDNGRQAGDLEGQDLLTRLRGALRAVSDDGTVIEGTFDVEQEVVAAAYASDATCERVVGDADRDRAVNVALGGLDCNDDDPAVSTTDEDGDGYSVCDLDCDDTDAAVGPGSGCDYVSIGGGITVDGYPGLTMAWSFVDPATTPCPSCAFTLWGAVDSTPMLLVAYDRAVRAAYLWTFGEGFTSPATLVPSGAYDRFTFHMSDVSDWGDIEGDFYLSYR